MNNFAVIIKEIIMRYDDYLTNNYTQFSHEFSADDKTVEIYIHPLGEPFRAYYFYNPVGGSKEIHLSIAFLTPDLQNKGLTKKLISIMYDVAKKYNFETYIVQITNQRFHEKLLNRGAVYVDSDSVQIVETTNLN